MVRASTGTHGRLLNELLREQIQARINVAVVSYLEHDFAERLQVFQSPPSGIATSRFRFNRRRTKTQKSNDNERDTKPDGLVERGGDDEAVERVAGEQRHCGVVRAAIADQEPTNERTKRRESELRRQYLC